MTKVFLHCLHLSKPCNFLFLDIDERKLGIDKCQADATFINTHDCYICACNPAFGRDSFNCTNNFMIEQSVYLLGSSHENEFLKSVSEKCMKSFVHAL